MPNRPSKQNSEKAAQVKQRILHHEENRCTNECEGSESATLDVFFVQIECRGVEGNLRDSKNPAFSDGITRMKSILRE